ncbi:protein indeterminate-domain 9-like [Cynara cardunculus var. scolymus]|nr:protein indeterminate-domain 9-like [Cynara cardunculus var. scolymus]
MNKEEKPNSVYVGDMNETELVRNVANFGAVSLPLLFAFKTSSSDDETIIKLYKAMDHQNVIKMDMAFGSSSMLLLGKWNEEDHVNLQEFDIKPDDHVVPPLQPLTVPLRKRKNPADLDAAEIVALSPTTLMTKNRFVCEVCHKGFPRDQNLQLHRRGHNLPWKLKQRTRDVRVKRKVYLCPEPSCIHHNPCHALGDLSGIKKHYSRKHVSERNYKCLRCPKMYAVESDLKAHLKVCGKKGYRCQCNTLFSRYIIS